MDSKQAIKILETYIRRIANREIFATDITTMVDGNKEVVTIGFIEVEEAHVTKAES